MARNASEVAGILECMFQLGEGRIACVNDAMGREGHTEKVITLLGKEPSLSQIDFKEIVSSSGYNAVGSALWREHNLVI